MVGDAGVIVPCRDAAALAAGIRKLLVDPQLRQNLALAGRQRVIERFNWGAVAAQLTDYYQAIRQPLET